MNEGDVPEGDQINDLYTGAYKPHILRIALRLDVFSPVDAGPASAETIARAATAIPSPAAAVLIASRKEST